jgi:hypothetical protein
MGVTAALPVLSSFSRLHILLVMVMVMIGEKRLDYNGGDDDNNGVGCYRCATSLQFIYPLAQFGYLLFLQPHNL